MTVQISQDNNVNTPFIRHSIPAAIKGDAVILQDAGRSTALAPFTVMGKKKYTLPTSGTAGTNTGNGTCTVVSANGKQSLKIGTYTIECVSAVTHGGIFKITDPDSLIVANNLAMIAGAGVATAFSVAGLVFTLTDGSTDFIVGDKFTIAVTSVAKFYPLKPSDTLGLESVAGIYLGDSILAATLVAGDVSNSKILKGLAFIDKNKLVFENSAALTTLLPSGKTVEEELAGLGIICIDTVDISAVENA